MSAVSAYAPPGRNSLLRRRPNSSMYHDGGGQGRVGKAAMAVLLLALGVVWNKDSSSSWVLRSLLQRLRRAARERLTYREDSVDPNHEEEEGSHSVPSNARDVDDGTHPIAGQEVQQEQPPSLARITENQHLIQKVLHFWFGQYSPDESQKRLWMIAHSSQALRDTVDEDIAREFQTLLVELSSCSNAAVTTHSATFREEASPRWKEWCGGEGDSDKDKDNTLLYGIQGKIAAIVVLDQFSRHILRHSSQTKGRPLAHSPDTACPQLQQQRQRQQQHFDAWALFTAQCLVQQHGQELKCGMVSFPMTIFSLMPFRHANTVQTVQFVQDQIEELVSRHGQMEAMLGRFRKATNRRMAVLQDEVRQSGRGTSGPRTGDTLLTATTTEADNVDGGVPSTGFTDEEILETGFFEADMSPARTHPCVKTIQDFLADRGVRPSINSKDNTKNKVAPAIPLPVIVSLSGGVDSMVIASVLVFLKSCCGYQLDIWAVHIDYANRPESRAEADFVRRYCQQLGIAFQLRRIDEVTRGVTARDQYERIARDLRYTFYKETISKATKGKDETIGVMLGHHRGDLRENVLSNAHKGCGPLDLSGMTAVSRNDGVLIYRPLLPLEKAFVFDYAHKFGVPYFKDTTPHWSTRGKIRNQLIPLLEEIYGEGSMKNLSNLAVESDECRALLQQSMIGPFLDRVRRLPMGIVFETTPWKGQGLFFWKVVLREALHSASFGMFSDKSVVSFLERVQAPAVREGWLQCRRDYAVYLQGDGRVFVLYPSSFPFSKKYMFDVEGQEVPYDHERRVGPWIVKAEILNENASYTEALGKEGRALPSMSHFMNGVLEYTVEVPTLEVNGTFVPRPLAFCRFSKASRPAAWRNKGSDEYLYLKVQETLPLLGNNVAVEASIASKTAFNSSCLDQPRGEEKSSTKLIVRVTLKVDRAQT